MKFKLIYLLCLFYTVANISAAQPMLIDLEQSSSQFIIETKKIEIPDHPNACNGSIVRWRGNILMSFRDIYDPILINSNDGSGLGLSSIGLIWLDSDFKPIGTPQFIEFEAFSSLPSMPEDPRLIVMDNDLYIVYSDNYDIEPFVERTRTYIAQIDYSRGLFYVKNEDCMAHFERDNRFLREKNWVPFIYDNTLLLAYSLVPHRILLPMIGTSTCKTVYLTRGRIDWNWGVLRGGTPGLKIDDSYYLAFFHSVLELPTVNSQGVSMPHYFIGAYTFNSSPPFQITQISDQPIVTKGFYSGIEYEPYWNRVKVVFPCGYIYDNNYIWLSYGRQDHEIWIVKMHRQGLLNSLKVVQTIHP